EARVKGVALSVELKAEEDDRLSNCNLNIKQVLPNLLNENVTFTYSLSVENIVNYIYSSDETLQLVAIHNYIDLLNKTIYDGSINDLVNDDIVSRSIELLDNHHNCRLQIEIIRVLIFMSLGTFKQMQSIIKYGAIPKLVKLLNSTEHYITQDIVISLGNIIKNRPYARDIALSHAILPRLAKLINSKISMIFTRHVVRTMFHVCKKSNPPLSFEMIKPVLPVFSYLLTIPNQSIISNTCWILAYLTEGCENNTRSLLGTGILPQVLGCLMCKEKNIFRPALRTIAHIVELGNIYETNAVISAGGLSHLCTFLRNHYMDEDIVVEIVSAIYKMVNTKEQIQCVISAGLLPLLIKILQFGEEEARHIVAWTVMDIIAEGSIEQLNELLNAGLLSIFYNLLEANDHNIVINALDCLIEILRAAEKVGQMEKFITMIKDAGILDKMETIQYQHDDLIYEVYSNTHAFLRGFVYY
ncbi:Importin subunit alpha-2, partial [Cyphomyrmex costatus]